MRKPGRIVRTAALATVCVAVFTGCATPDPLARLVAYEGEKGTCIDFVERRLAASLKVARLPGDIDRAVGAIIDLLPAYEREALARAGEIFVAEHGGAELPRGSDLEQNAYWSALYRGFAGADVCSWSSHVLSEFVTASIFIDRLDALLRSRGVDTGSPNFAHTDLVVALVRAAAGLPSDKSLETTPFRGADHWRNQAPVADPHPVLDPAPVGTYPASVQAGG